MCFGSNKLGVRKVISLLNWNSGFSFKPPAANSMVYPCIQVCGIPIFEIRCLDLEARVQGPREPRAPRTRTRTHTIPYDTKAIAAGEVDARALRV